MTMVSPKQLGVGDSDVTLSRRKSLRTRSSKRTAPEVTEAEEETKKKQKKMINKKKKKKTKLSEPLITRIWNDEDVLSILKGLVDYRAKTGLETKIDWDEFYRFLGGSIVEKFSKGQVNSKIRKLKKKYYVQMEKIKQGNDRKLTRSSDSKAFGYSEMIWGQIEAGVDKEMLHVQEEQLNDNAAVTEQQSSGRLPQQSEGGEQEKRADDEPFIENEAVTEKGTAPQAQLSKSGEEMLKEQEEEADDEPLNDNEAVEIMENGTARKPHQTESGKEHGEEARAAKIAENKNTNGKEGDDDSDELCGVKDAFETLLSQGLTDYQKKLELEKLMNIGTDKRRELSEGWKALCDEERRFNIKKLRFAAKLAEGVSDG